MKNFFHSVLLLAAALLCVDFTVNAQDLIPDQNKKGKWGYVDNAGKKIINYDYDHANAFIDGRALVKKGDKWGYINERGKEVIKIKFTEIGTWNGSYCKVGEGGKVEDGVVTGAKYGYIDRSGEYVLKTEYDEIGPFKDEIAYVKKDKKYGYIDSRFNFVIPVKYSGIGSFNDKGFCWVRDGKSYGVYNLQGNIVVPVKFKALGTFNCPLLEANPILARIVNDPDMAAKIKEYGKEHKNELVNAVKVKANLNPFSFKNKTSVDKKAVNKYHSGLVEMINTVADSLLPEEDKMLLAENLPYDMPSYSFVEEKNFTELDMDDYDYFVVSNNMLAVAGAQRNMILNCKGDKIGIYSSAGEEVLKSGKFDIAFLPSEGIVPVARYKKDNLEVNYYRISSDKLLFKNWIDAEAISPFENGTAVVYKSNMNFLINKNGETISDFYSFIFPPVDGVHVVVEKNRYGLIDDKGGSIVSPSYNLILPKKEGVLCAQKERGGLFGFIDDNGKDVIAPQYKIAHSFRHGFAMVKSDKGWGVIDHNVNPVIDLKWQEILPIESKDQKLAWVKDGDKWCCLDIASKKMLFTTTFTTVTNFNDNGYSIVGDELYGCIDADGNIIIPLGIDNPENVSECLEIMNERGVKTLGVTDVYRFNLYKNDVRNQYKLTDIIDSSMWDY